MKKIILAVAAMLMATGAFSAEDTTSVLYEKNNWEVIRDDDPRGSICYIAYWNEDKTKIALAFTDLNESFEALVLQDDPKIGSRFQLHFGGLENKEDTFSLNVTGRADSRLLVATDSYDIKGLMREALTLEIDFGSFQKTYPLDGGYALFPAYERCLEEIK